MSNKRKKIVKTRVDHSAVLWPDDATRVNKIVIFGGFDNSATDLSAGDESNETGTNIKIKPIRNCLSSMCIFDTQTQIWSHLEVSGEDDGFTPEPRRNHAVGLFNNHMLIVGGIDNHKKVLNDVLSFNLVRKEWNQIYSLKEQSNSSYMS